MSVTSSPVSTAPADRTPIAAWPLVALIHLYRYTFGPTLAGCCRFAPSCSQYAEQALRKHGLWYGSTLAIKRLLRCHPWHPGGWDPVP